MHAAACGPALCPVRQRDPDMPEFFLHIGTVTKAHGIKGEVSVAYHAASLALLDGPLFFQANSGERRPCRVESVRKEQGRLHIRFAGIEDRNAAERLRGSNLVIPADALPPPDDNEVYVHELLNMRVVILHDNGEEEPLGTIENISVPAGQELWTIRALTGEEILFPAVPEFIRNADMRKREAYITPPPGLIELYRNPR